MLEGQFFGEGKLPQSAVFKGAEGNFAGISKVDIGEREAVKQASRDAALTGLKRDMLVDTDSNPGSVAEAAAFNEKRDKEARIQLAKATQDDIDLVLARIQEIPDKAPGQPN
jgi:hypothetical protein